MIRFACLGTLCKDKILVLEHSGTIENLQSSQSTWLLGHQTQSLNIKHRITRHKQNTERMLMKWTLSVSCTESGVLRDWRKHCNQIYKEAKIMEAQTILLLLFRTFECWSLRLSYCSHQTVCLCNCLFPFRIHFKCFVLNVSYNT